MIARVGEALTAKYSTFRTPRTEMPDDTRTHYERPFVVVRIAAEERIVSWDNTKLGLE